MRTLIRVVLLTWLLCAVLAAGAWASDAFEATMSAGQDALLAGDSEAARDEFHRALDLATDPDQAERAGGRLRGLGEQVDTLARLGLVRQWRLLGPVDPRESKQVLEKLLSLTPREIRSAPVELNGKRLPSPAQSTDEPAGLLELAKVFPRDGKGHCLFAVAVVTSPREQTAELRYATHTSASLWLNGRALASPTQPRDPAAWDANRVPVQLIQGPNILVVRLLGDNAPGAAQPAPRVSLQFRFCNPAGRGLGLTSR